MLFNAIIDSCIEDLPAEVGASHGDERVPYIAIADDLTLTKESTPGLVASLKHVVSKLKFCGWYLMTSRVVSSPSGMMVK